MILAWIWDTFRNRRCRVSQQWIRRERQASVWRVRGFEMRLRQQWCSSCFGSTSPRRGWAWRTFGRWWLGSFGSLCWRGRWWSGRWWTRLRWRSLLLLLIRFRSFGSCRLPGQYDRQLCRHCRLGRSYCFWNGTWTHQTLLILRGLLLKP